MSVFTTTWSPDGHYLSMRRRLADSYDHTQVVLDTATMSIRAEFDHADVRYPAVFHPDGDHVVLPRGKKTPIIRLSDCEPPAPDR